MEDGLGRKLATHKKYGLQSTALSVMSMLTISTRRNITLCCGLRQKTMYTAANVSSAAKLAEKGNKMPERPKVYISRSKQDYIFGQGFKFRLKNQVFIHRKKKTVMSFEFAEKYDLDVIRRILLRLQEKSKDGWTIHFVERPSTRFRKQLIEEFESGV
jgi:hypothetical protein